MPKSWQDVRKQTLSIETDYEGVRVLASTAGERSNASEGLSFSGFDSDRNQPHISCHSTEGDL